MKTTPLFQTLLLVLMMAAAGAFANRAWAQYQSFFGDSITEYSIGTFATMYDPDFFGLESHSLGYSMNDTVVFNGTTYFKATPLHLWSDFIDDYYVREDTSLGHLYRYDPHTETEYLICDMSLEKGDTFVFPLHPDFAFNMPISGIVDTIVYLNGKKNIIFRTDTASNSPCSYPLSLYFENRADEHIPIMFMEGIGPNYTPCGWMNDYFFECEGGYFYMLGTWNYHFQYPLLLCVHKNGELTYMADERAGCDQRILSVKEEEPNKWNIYPNPAHNFLNIKFEGMIVPKGKFYITNIIGVVMYMQEVNDSHFRINTRNLNSGIYIATWVSGEKKQSIKFIKK